MIRHVGEFAFVGVGEPRPQLGQGHPRDLGDLDVGVGQFATEVAEQIVVHGLVHAPALGDEPVVDAAEFGQDLAADARLLVDFAHGRFLGGLTLLDVPFGQRPQKSPAPVGAADQRGTQLLGRTTETVDDQSPGGGLPHRPQLGFGGIRPGTDG